MSVSPYVARIRAQWSIETAPGGTDARPAGQVALRSFLTGLQSGAISAIEFAEAVWWLACEVPEFEPTLRPFIGMASEWQDDAIHRLEYEDDIRVAALGLELPI
jgi:hypothetical protein